MRAAASPRLHLFVCANRRDGASTAPPERGRNQDAKAVLGPGCAERGDALYDALKTEVAARGEVASIWVTKTHCLGICPKRGATVAQYPGARPIRADVEVGDVAALLDSDRDRDRDPGPDWNVIERELVAIEELQTEKVLDLARRLKPGLTLEDVQNPHDFPELDDPDWHYADGILTGMKSVTSALRALRRRSGGSEGD
jgi:hypothetical protein